MPPTVGNSMLRTALRAPDTALPTGMWQTIRYLMNQPTISLEAPSRQGSEGIFRLWRGVQTIMMGCIPAHALYFSSYELVKAAGGNNVLTSSLAGAAAVCSHDIIMTPLDTIKQRMQLGHYNNSTRLAVNHILRTEGWKAFYRSFPITLATNVPYGMVMVSTNEACKQALQPDGGKMDWRTILASSSVAGCIASAVTTPLDRIKTALQTQQLAPACRKGIMDCPMVRHSTWQDAALAISKEEGLAGFFRGLSPRILSHTPAVAISWTSYEMIKQYLMNQYST